MKVLIVDDEPPARRRLARMLADVPDVVVVGEAGDGESAVQLARTLQPDVMLLDVQLPGMDGVTLAQRTLGLPPIIFCTAWDAYAVKAFELNAVDYLLKPVRPERLALALERARSRRPGAPVLETLAPVSATRLMATTRGEVRFFDARQVSRFWASEKYTLFRADGEEHLIEESLSSLEQRLPSSDFLRVHRAELIRLSAVKSLSSDEDGAVVTLDDGQRARVSRRSLSAVKEALAG